MSKVTPVTKLSDLLLYQGKGVPSTPSFWWFTRKTQRTQQIVILNIKAKGNKAKAAKRKGRWYRRNQTQVSKSLFPWESYRIHLTPPEMLSITRIKYCLQGKFIRDSARFFLAFPLSTMHQNSRLLDGKQVFDINHTVQFRHSEPLFTVQNCEFLLKSSQEPRASLIVSRPF